MTEKVPVYAERLLPHDIACEEAVLGAIVIDGEAIARIDLSPDDFYRERNGMIYRAAADLYEREQQIDQLTIAAELARHDRLEAAGGIAYLSHLVAITPTSAHIEGYAERVRETAGRRRLIDVAALIAAKGYSEDQDFESAMRSSVDAVAGVVSDAIDREQDRSYAPLADHLDGFLGGYGEPDDPLPQARIFTGYPSLDELLGGIARARQVVIGARPAVGKSALALGISLRAAKAGHTVAYTSLEMPGEDLALRILSAETGIDSFRLDKGLITSAEEDEAVRAVGRLSELPFFISVQRGMTVQEMRRRLNRLRLERKQEVDLLVVDYIQEMSPRSYAANREQQVGGLIRDLYVLAGELNSVNLVCAQLNREIHRRADPRPQMSDLRESGSLEQSADVVMFIHRMDQILDEDQWAAQHPGDPYPAGMADIIVAKHRMGPTGVAHLYFDRQRASFREIPVAPGA